MPKKLLVFFAFLSLHIFTVSASFFSQFKAELIEKLQMADQQCEWMRALLEHKNVKLEDLSIEEVNKTITDLELYIDRLLIHGNYVGKLTEEETRCLNLTKELVRHLTNARLAYKQKIEADESVKKIAISVGAGAAVFGGLLLLNAVTPLDISPSAAALCGLVTACGVGAITHFDSLTRGMRSVSHMVHNRLPRNSSWRDGLTAAAAVGVAAVTVGVVYVNRKSMVGSLFGPSRQRQSLESMVQSAGLAGHTPIV